MAEPGMLGIAAGSALPCSPKSDVQMSDVQMHARQLGWCARAASCTSRSIGLVKEVVVDSVGPVDLLLADTEATVDHEGSKFAAGDEP